MMGSHVSIFRTQILLENCARISEGFVIVFRRKEDEVYDHVLNHSQLGIVIFNLCAMRQ